MPLCLIVQYDRLLYRMYDEVLSQCITWSYPNVRWNIIPMYDVTLSQCVTWYYPNVSSDIIPMHDEILSQCSVAPDILFFDSSVSVTHHSLLFSPSIFYILLFIPLLSFPLVSSLLLFFPLFSPPLLSPPPLFSSPLLLSPLLFIYRLYWTWSKSKVGGRSLRGRSKKQRTCSWDKLVFNYVS